MGARLINNPRQTNRGHIDAVLPLDIKELRKSGFFNEGQLTQCSFRYAGLSILVDVDLRFEFGAQLILRFKNGDSITDSLTCMQMSDPEKLTPTIDLKGASKNRKN